MDPIVEFSKKLGLLMFDVFSYDNWWIKLLVISDVFFTLI